MKLNHETANMNTAKSKKHWIRYAVALLILANVIGTGYLYSKYAALRKNPNAEAQAATASLTAKVSKHLDLPKGETPTIATVEDKSKLKKEAFFSSAENGDKLLIYANAKKAIIYRPAGDRIINVGPIAVNSAPSEGTKNDAKN